MPPVAGPTTLGIDVGSTSTKVALVHLPGGADDAPGVLATAAAPTPADADGLVATVLRLVRGVLARSPTPPAAVGVASMAESGVPLDRRDDALTPILRWDGARGGAQARRLGADLGAEAVYAATGVRLAAKTPLVTWAWLAAEHPDVGARTRRWAGAADLVALALTGRLTTDHTLAGRTGAYLLEDADGGLPAGFDADLLTAVGWHPDALPEVVRPGDRVARATTPVAVAAGVARGTPVVVAGHDHPVGAWAAGVRRAGQVADSLGTAEAVLTVLGAPPAPGRAALRAAGTSLVRTVEGAAFGLLAGTPDAGALVRRWLDDLGDAAGPARAVLDGGTAAPGRPSGDLVLPYPSGRTSPHPDPAARLRFLTAAGAEVDGVALVERAGDPPAEAARWTLALLDGLALHARWLLTEQARLAGAAPSAVTVVGGAGVACRPWLWAKAAATPVALRVVGGEPVAAGAAVLAGHRAGLAPGAAPVLAASPVGDAEVSARAAAPAYDALAERFVLAALGSEG